MLLDETVYDVQTGQPLYQINKEEAPDYHIRLSGWSIGTTPFLSPNTTYRAQPVFTNSGQNTDAPQKTILELYRSDANIRIATTDDILPADIIRFLFSPDEKHIVAWHACAKSLLCDQLAIIEVETGKFVQRTTIEQGIGSIAWSADGRSMVIGEDLSQRILFFNVK